MEVQGGVTAPAGFLAGGLHCGIKESGEPDLAIIFSERRAAVSGLFTKNLVKAAPVLYSQKVVEGGIARAVVANSGNANAVTGEQGKLDTEKMARTTAECLSVSPYEVAVASTGTIGRALPIDRIVEGIKGLVPALSREGGEAAAGAIMTTDTFPKTIAVKVPLSRGEIVVGGMAKGAGMICPDLATMLAFITTDASIEPAFLLRALEAVTETSFNSITVDGDGSTNDTVLVMANGASDASPIKELSEDYYIFRSALQHVCAGLAEMIVRDGEGASKLVRINVVGAVEKADAQKIAKTIANSLLVKTAIFGSDANWGRVVAATGRAGVEIDPELVDIQLGELTLLRAGYPQDFNEEQAKELLSRKEVSLTVDLHLGGESATVLTCDLSYDYVKINASYRT
ncbi:MAG: bifunctional glutamate N-acetyltransferase/amino-acid acetyltransferase ArgJ [Candidatus Hydrogenedentota bacterium]|nr:MAG: bifunctional glutamate N-acetyltransferase/amino-acid acetyltransferase ArgJ [Candidatus Hydrogenedentota bacterium]